jgi:hypothetical protein
MNNNTGIVMEVSKSHAFIMTNSGEFLKIKVGKAVPAVGEIYSGEIVKETPFYKYIATAASLMFMLLFGGTAYAYYTPTASVRVDINPSIELKINRWDRIIKTVALNSDGEKVLNEISIKNMPLNEGLDTIVEEAKKDNFITDKYTESGKIIKISIEAKNPERKPDITKFEEKTKKNNLNINVTDLKSQETPQKKDNRNSDETIKKPKDDKDSTKAPVDNDQTSPSNDNNKEKDKGKNNNNKNDKSSNTNSNSSVPASIDPKSKEDKEAGPNNSDKGKSSGKEVKDNKDSKNNKK